MDTFMRWITPPFVILAAAIVVFAVTSIGATGSLPRGSLSQANLNSAPAPMSGARLASQGPIARSGDARGPSSPRAIVRSVQPGRRNLGGSAGGIMVLVTLLTKSALEIGLPGLATYLAYIFFLQRREGTPTLA